MANPSNPLQIPPDVAEALRRGDPIGAMKLMRKANPKMGLGDVKRFLEAVQKLAPRPPTAGAPAAPVPKPSTPSSARGSSPHNPRTPHVVTTFERTGLSPGEVPRTGDSTGVMALMIVAVLALLLYVRFG